MSASLRNNKKMIPSARHQKILTRVTEKGTVSISELMLLLNVSHMTIRRDIQKLEAQGAIIAVSGGIQTIEKLIVESSHSDKAMQFSAEKEQIGILAAEQIGKSTSVYLDAGTTTLAIAKHIAHRDDLLIITNDLVVANFLIESSKSQLIFTGGFIHRENQSCVGEFTAQMLRNFYVDIAFVSASSWSLKGLTTPEETKVAVKRAIVDSSAKCILVSDTSKYGKIGTYFAIPIAVFDTIITDFELPDSTRNTLTEMGIKVIA